VCCMKFCVVLYTNFSDARRRHICSPVRVPRKSVCDDWGGGGAGPRGPPTTTPGTLATIGRGGAESQGGDHTRGTSHLGDRRRHPSAHGPAAGGEQGILPLLQGLLAQPHIPTPSRDYTTTIGRKYPTRRGCSHSTLPSRSRKQPIRRCVT
jgi:hypothetical protein